MMQHVKMSPNELAQVLMDSFMRQEEHSGAYVAFGGQDNNDDMTQVILDGWFDLIAVAEDVLRALEV